MAQSFQDLLVWQKAIQMSVAVYKATQVFPRQEIYGLASQLQRAAVSVASNIAEGRGRLTNGEFKHFLGMAQGSNYEVQTQITIARQLDLSGPDLLNQAEKLSIEVGKTITAETKSLKLKAKS